MTWSEEIIDRLAALKLTGYGFDACWERAIRDVPPRGRECGAGGATLSLLERSPGEEYVEFVRQACEDAWEGRRPALAHLSTALDHHVLVGLEVDGPMSQVQARGRTRPAALSGNV